MELIVSETAWLAKQWRRISLAQCGREVAGSKAGRICADRLSSDRRLLREHWERKGCLVEESQLSEESRMRRFLLLGRYLGTIAGYLENSVVGQNFIFRRDFLGIMDFSPPPQNVEKLTEMPKGEYGLKITAVVMQRNGKIILRKVQQIL